MNIKNLYCILIVTLLLNSCDKNEDNAFQNNLFSQDFQKLKVKEGFEIISIDSIDNFAELRKEMGELTCEGKISGLKFDYEGRDYHLTGISRCPKSGETGCYFRKNVFNIRNDSLVFGLGDKQYSKPIEYLKSELETIVATPYKYKSNEDKLKTALIHLYIKKEQPITTTKKVLKEIVEQFAKLNTVDNPEYFEYIILFESFDISSIPPPPPPKKNEV